MVLRAKHDRVTISDVDRFSSLSAIRLETGEFRFSLGLTAPIHLLSYRFDEVLPPYCRRGAILDKLETAARSRGCEVSWSDLGGVRTQIISCPLVSPTTDGDPKCPSSYVAQIWLERWSGSSEDYELDMYARVRTVCAREQDFATFHASDEITASAEKQSDEVTRLLASCRVITGVTR